MNQPEMEGLLLPGPSTPSSSLLSQTSYDSSWSGSSTAEKKFTRTPKHSDVFARKDATTKVNTTMREREQR